MWATATSKASEAFSLGLHSRRLSDIVTVKTDHLNDLEVDIVAYVQ